MKLFKTIGITVLICIAISTAVYFLCVKPDKVADGDIKNTPVSLKQAIVRQYVDSLTHQNHTAFTNKQGGLNPSALTNGVISKPLLDSISKSIGIKETQVESYQKISMVSEAKALKAEKKADSLQRIVYSYTSKYVDLSFTTPDSTHINGEFGYKYRTDIQSVQYTPKKFLGIPIGQDVIDISSTDPNATINGLSAFSIKPQERFFGFELQALAQYNYFNQTISPGLGLQLRFGRFYATAGQYYNVNTNKYNTLIGSRFALFKY